MKSILFLFLLKFLTFIWCERVKVDVFYETLCPYCQNYFVNEIFPLIQTELATKITLRLFPYGNAIMQSNGSIKCQV
jgi:interferon, gamma-inducible protein 30